MGPLEGDVKISVNGENRNLNIDVVFGYPTFGNQEKVQEDKRFINTIIANTSKGFISRKVDEYGILLSKSQLVSSLREGIKKLDDNNLMNYSWEIIGD